jgi:hypothetical protein
MKIRTNVRAGIAYYDRCGGSRCGGTRCGGSTRCGGRCGGTRCGGGPYQPVTYEY